MCCHPKKPWDHPPSDYEMTERYTRPPSTSRGQMVRTKTPALGRYPTTSLGARMRFVARLPILPRVWDEKCEGSPGTIRGEPTPARTNGSTTPFSVRKKSRSIELRVIADARSRLPNGSGAQLQSVGRRRLLRHRGLIPERTRRRKEHAVSRPMPRLATRRATPWRRWSCRIRPITEAARSRIGGQQPRECDGSDGPGNADRGGRADR
jgi:hypothetical protein